jgi:thioredoxin 1
MTIKVLYFSASWCSPCKSFKPVVQSVLTDHPQINFNLIDIEEEPDLSQEHKIRSVPTIVVLKDNVVIDKFSGSMSKDKFKEKVESYI